MALQMSRRRGAWRKQPGRKMEHMAAWLSTLGLAALGANKRDTAYWSAQLAA